MPNFFGIVASAIAKKILDTFSRTTSGSLGSANTGQVWTATKGTWSANGSQATSADAATNYSIASIPFSSTTTVSASMVEGTGISYWVSDANNWYAIVSYNAQTPYSCGCSTCCNTCVNSACGCATYNTCANAACGTYTNCNSCTVVSSFCYDGIGSSAGACAGTGGTWITAGSYTNNCSACGGTTVNNTCATAACGCAVYNSCANCTACGSYSCGCSTCYNNYYYLRNLKAVSGTVSQVVSDFAISASALSVKAVVNAAAGTITEYAYSDSALTTQIGTTTITPTSPLKGANVGIIKAPAGLIQGSTVDNFSAS